MLPNIALSLLLFPGLALALVLGVLLGWLLERRWPGRGVLRLGSLRGLPGQVALLSIGLAGAGLALLPWPFHPAAGWAAIGSPALVWALFEAAALLPLLPGYLSPQPLAARAAVREAQIGVAGRCVFWLAAGAALWGQAWSLPRAPGFVLVALGGLLALPAAIGAGPFGAERSLAPAGAEEGLDEDTKALVRLARSVRGAALIAALGVALLPATWGQSLPPALAGRATSQIQPAIGLAIVALLFAALALSLRQLAGVLPRLTLPAALRWCWLRALPLALVGLIYLAVI